MSEDILDVENTQEENESMLNNNMEETVENTVEVVNEAAEEVEKATVNAEETIEPENTLTDSDTEKPARHGKGWLIILLCVLAAAIIGVGLFFLLKNTGKYKGFKKDKASGIYYKFHTVHEDAAMPKTGDYVGFLFSMRAGDSILIPMIPNEMLMDSIGKNDLYAALRMMHVDDSATFIFNGQEFFDLMMEGQEYPFGEDPLYLDVMLYGHMPKAEFEKAKAKYEAEMEELKGKEVDTILQYVKDNHLGQPTEEGIYIKTTKRGNGPQVKEGQSVTVHYVGRLLDGTEFDSSIGRDEPFTFTMGAHKVIPGWEIAVGKMHVGEKATVLIPSSMAYGERGNAVIPPYSPLTFEIEVLKAEDAQTPVLGE